MSGGPKPPDAPVDDVTVEEFAAFAFERNIATSCEMCKTESWVVVTDVEGKVPSLYAKSYPGDLADAYTLPLIINICQNCGNIRSFARSYIDDWRKKKGENA